jgi:hypothetical protein
MRSLCLLLLGLFAFGSSSSSSSSSSSVSLAFSVVRGPFPFLLPVHAYDVRLTRGATDIESNFPASVKAASTFADSAAVGYPIRALHPLKGAVLTVCSELIARAGAAFQATEPQFDMRYASRTTNGELKQLFFSDGQQQQQQQHAAAECTCEQASDCSFHLGCLCLLLLLLCSVQAASTSLRRRWVRLQPTTN